MPPPTARTFPTFLAGDGEMATLIRSLDWAATPLGPPQAWRPTLKAMVRMALTTRHPIFIFWGPEHVCLYNDAYRASLGPEKHPAMLGARGADQWPEIWPAIGPQIEFVLRGEGATWHENQFLPILRHGEMQDVYWTYSYGPIDDEQAPHGVGGVLVVCTETTEQVLTARRLVVERERFAELFEQAPTFMAVLRGADHTFELVNPGYTRLIGHRQVLGRTVADAMPDAIEQGYGVLLDEVFRSGEAFLAKGAQFSVQATPGGAKAERWVDFVYQPIKDSEGAVTGIFVEGVDVTEQREAEAALRDSEERFRLAVDSSQLGTWDTDLADGRITLSPRALELFDLDHSGASFEAVMARVHPDDRRRVAEAIAQARAPQGSGDYRVRHRVSRRDGSIRWLSATGRVSHVQRPDGSEQVRFVGVLSDVTEQQQLMDVLREADRRKDEFLATLAHELRNPLAPIRTAAHLLAMPDLPSERVAWCADLIRRQSATMALLLDDLLEVSRISSGKLELRRARTDARAIVAAAVETARPTVDARHHRLDIVVPDDLPLIDADALRIAQVLTNLLTNAAKYTDPHGQIGLQVRHVPGHLLFEVTDNGIGLEPAALQAIFQMFHQVQGARDRAQGGLGIGLSLSQGLAALHAGRVEAFSDGIGRGSMFRLTLPVDIGSAG